MLNIFADQPRTC